ncbi:HNH endonuclease [Leptospira santarosai]|uniref:HNH endonuclease domain protein n=1 Tax=Leptospira santarosai serovar Arenal str. MAVJ 401 TaxID=1049976 RepID=M6JKK2_9LEPT|nr:HNH endonuclease signature motif containing protein [Leptospira santarosai]EMN22434.1 HNH endonuclease domain protein [Leptospira santarosai serovar Arenal str. MAVJ 401]MDI7225511.1 HNH endonuclease signature motif containing protein [Leptospira santarosai]MDI7237900.1 HNH endonuclease signature motif containing protein [Leptospira santarosai]
MNSYQKIIDKLSKRPILNDSLYFSVFLGSDRLGNLIFDTVTNWSGYQIIEGKEVELRKPRPINPKAFVQYYNGTAAIVNNRDDLRLFFLIGGQSIMLSTLYFEEFGSLDTFVYRNNGRFYGFNVIDNIEVAVKRNPTPKLRMKILNRDNRRCRICGRSPNLYIDLELHVHHILPWELGGLTVEDNMITLCKVCHDGLEPHYDDLLYDLIEMNINKEEMIAMYRFHVSSSMTK